MILRDHNKAWTGRAWGYINFMSYRTEYIKIKEELENNRTIDDWICPSCGANYRAYENKNGYWFIGCPNWWRFDKKEGCDKTYSLYGSPGDYEKFGI